PKKNTPARVKAAALTEKKRPHGHAEPPAGAAAAAGARRTYPETSQRRLQQRAQQQGEEEDSLNSSASSLGAYLAFGTRLPLSALKKGPRSPPLQPLPTNVDNRSYGCGGKKRERPRKSNGETVVKRIHAPSPLPRPPASGDGAPCALSSALSSACARTGAAAVTTNATSATFTRGPGGVDGVAEKGKGRPPQHRPRPSVIVAKDAWGGGKTDDVFADIFSL
ncbi:hypothetical protein DQ04_10751000, partial [Trypanosoma grayi]|uniref:hypothetical protein n=1 Tax=Trypanosoma grayi TaxID=71804 RepID=UPI0004F4B258